MMGARIWSTCLGIYITEFTSVHSRNLWTVSSWVCRETLESKPRGEDPPPTWEASFRSMLTLNDPRLRQNTTETYNLPDAKSSLFRPGYEKYSIIRCESVNSIHWLHKTIHLLNAEQDANHPSSSKKSADGRITNHQYATLPALEPVHDDGS